MDRTELTLETDSATAARAGLEEVLYEIKRVIVGQDAMLERLLVALLTGGHVLLEGVPGLAKTLTVKTLADVVSGSFKRVQFTPDLVPADLVGTRIYRPDSGRFDVELGTGAVQLPAGRRDQPRAREGAVGAARGDAGGPGDDRGAKTTRCREPFLVLATQNPIESEGTYPLPEAQTDRFLMKLLVDYPSPGEEAAVVGRSLEAAAGRADAGARGDRPSPVPGRRCRECYVDREVIGYAVTLADATRNPDAWGLGGHRAGYIEYGVSPRGPIGLVQAARALALLRGRTHAIALGRSRPRARRAAPPARAELRGAERRRDRRTRCSTRVCRGRAGRRDSRGRRIRAGRRRSMAA